MRGIVRESERDLVFLRLRGASGFDLMTQTEGMRLSHLLVMACDEKMIDKPLKNG